MSYEFHETSTGYTGAVTQIHTNFEIPNRFWNVTLEDGSEWTLQKHDDVWDKVAFIARP